MLQETTQNSIEACLESWPNVAEGEDLVPQRGQNRIDWSRNCSLIAAHDEEIRDGRHDANIRLDTNWWQRGREGGRSDVVDDLGVLHALPRRDVQRRHVRRTLLSPTIEKIRAVILTACVLR